MPVDYVAEVMEGALYQPRGRRRVPRGRRRARADVTDLIEHPCGALDRQPPNLTPPGTLDPDHPAAVFEPYFDVHTRFGDRRARSLLPNSAGPPPPQGYMPAPIDYGLQAGRPSPRRAPLSEG